MPITFSLGEDLNTTLMHSNVFVALPAHEGSKGFVTASMGVRTVSRNALVVYDFECYACIQYTLSHNAKC